LAFFEEIIVSNLLINEPPLMVLPTLAAKIGLNEAIILQQIHYWIDPRGNKNLREGRHWVYNSYKDWKKQFPFWAERTLQRAILSLEKLKLIMSSNFSKNPLDKTKWYTINYDELSIISKGVKRTCQNGIIDDAKLFIRSCQNGTIYNKNTETTTEITTSSLNPSSKPRPVEGVSQNRRRRKNNFIDDQKNIYSTNQESFKASDIAISMMQLWNDLVGQGRDPLALTPKTSALMEKVLGEEFQGSLDQWKSYCLKISSSKYLMGETEQGFKATLGWCLTQSTIEKILGGRYTTGTRNVIPLVKPELEENQDTRELINEAERNLIKGIRAGEGNLPFMDVFRRRVKLGLEGFYKKEKFERTGWYRGGFQSLLDDYINDLTLFAPHYSKDQSIGKFVTPELIFLEEEDLMRRIRAGEGDLPFEEVFIKRIKSGLEGIARQGKLELDRFYRGEFKDLLEDYIEHVTYRAQNPSNDNVELLNGGRNELSTQLSTQYAFS
jgi:hypothetical protein